MNKNYFLFIFTVVIILSAGVKTSFAQQRLDSTNLYHVELIDGTEFTGNIISEDDTSYRFATERLASYWYIKRILKH